MSYKVIKYLFFNRHSEHSEESIAVCQIYWILRYAQNNGLRNISVKINRNYYFLITFKVYELRTIHQKI